ncbi:MAG: DUF6069 family protein [Stackebrandtia sp.]
MSVDITTPVPQRNPRSFARRTWLATMFAATVLPALLWLIVVSAGGHDLAADVGGTVQHVDLAPVCVGAAVSASCGMGMASWLRRFKHRRRIWWTVALIALAGSLLSPLGGTTTITVVVLLSMHLIVGAVVIAGGLALPGPSQQ